MLFQGMTKKRVILLINVVINIKSMRIFADNNCNYQ